MSQVFQDHLPSAPWMSEATRRLPGLQPLEEARDWLIWDEAFAGQMAERDRLVAEQRDAVIAATPDCGAAVTELYAAVLERIARRGDYALKAGSCLRPDGVRVALEPGDPLGTLARLVQQDLCVLERPEGAAEHILGAAVLCFPASWMLSEKIGRPLTGIHAPVAEYGDGMARRVQRVFDHLHVSRPVWRQNALIYEDPALFQPRRMEARRARPDGAAFLRSERQCLLRLPQTRAVVFSIHTYVVPLDRLTPAQRAGLAAVAAVT